LPFLRALEKEDDTYTTVGNTYENSRNLPKKFIKKIEDKYGGTRLGRQEIEAEILTDNPRALWLQERIDELRVDSLPEDLIRLVYGVDPAVSSSKKSDETGIIGGGLADCKCRGEHEQHTFVFDDLSGIYKPHEWGRKVVDAYTENMADLVVAEINNGGELVEQNLRTTDRGENVSYKGIHASKGKVIRHEPIANLCTQGKVHHVGRLSRLEDQLTQWDPTQGKSPDRADAYTITVTELMLEKETKRGEVGIRVFG
jgi:phage terminase large subunit-like protein